MINQFSSHDCHGHAKCINIKGAAESYTCSCEDGYDGDGKTCTDIDECNDGSHKCPTFSDCDNTIGRFLSGFSEFQKAVFRVGNCFSRAKSLG